MKKLIAAATLALASNPVLADEVTYRVVIGMTDVRGPMIVGVVHLYDVETKRYSSTEANFKMCEEIIRNMPSWDNGRIEWNCIIDFDNPITKQRR